MLTLILCNSNGLAGVNIHDSIFPVTATAVNSVNCVPAVVGLPVCSCWLHYFTSILAFAGVPTVLTLLLFLSVLLLLAFLLFQAFMLNKLSALLLIIGGVSTLACVTAVACVPDVTGVPDVASVSLVPAVLTVAGVPAVDGGAIARFPADSGIPSFSWCLSVLYSTIRYIRQSDYRIRLPDYYFFSAIGLSEYRISDWQV